MSVYQDVFQAVKNSKLYTVTPRQIFESNAFNSVSSVEFLNAFNTLKNNGLIEEAYPSKFDMSNWSVEYHLVEPKVASTKNSHIQFDTNDLYKIIEEEAKKKELRGTQEVTAKVAEQTEKGNVLNDLNKIVNDLNQLYARIEKLETPNNFDISKFTRKELLQELSRRED